MKIKFLYTLACHKLIKNQYLNSLQLCIDKEKLNIELFSYEKSISKALDVIFLDKEEALESFKLFNSHMVVILFKDEMSSFEVNELKKYFSYNLLGFIDTSEQIEKYIPLFKNAISHLVMKANVGDSINVRMVEALYNESLSELERIKKMHSRLVPMRMENFKNFSLVSKFASGLSSGGEFFDLHETSQEVVIVLGSFQSYLATSVIVRSFEEIKKLNKVTEKSLLSFLENFTNDCRDINLIDRDNYETLQLDIIHIDKRSLFVSGHHFGGSRLFINGQEFLGKNRLCLNENNYERSCFNFLLNRNDKIGYFSSGSVKNFESDSYVIEELLVKYGNISIKELVNEFMFQLKEKGLERFLKYDTSLIFLEVNSNAIITV